MKFERQYYRCSHCGKIIGIINEAAPPTICCGEPMGLLTANTTDAAQEKHVPVASRNGKVLTVTVGSAEHPMTPEHYITWIAVAQEGRTQRAALSPGAAPSAQFHLEDGPATVYAYCNLHGLWTADV